MHVRWMRFALMGLVPVLSVSLPCRVRAADPPAQPAITAAAPRSVPPKLPGMRPTGEILLPTQWSLRPTGAQIKLGDFPVHIALHPQAPYAAVLHSGYGDHEIQIVHLAERRVVSSVILPQTFYGLTFDPTGARLFASGAEYEVIYGFRFRDGYLSDQQILKVAEPSEKRVPIGVTCSRDGRRLFVACGWGHSLGLLPLEPAGPAEHLALPADSYPYTALESPDGRRLFVSLWGAAAVAVIDLSTKQVTATWPTDSHPTELLLSPRGDTLYVACANGNSVSVLDPATGAPLETISSALYPQAPRGSTPNSIALTPDGKVLFIANADNNNLAAFDVSQRRQSRSLGHIPVGWYPTSVRYHAASNLIYVANGKGLLPRANRQGPNPLTNPPRDLQEYIAGLFRGTLSVIEPPAPADMVRLTKAAYACSPLRPDAGSTAPARSPDHPIPAQVGAPSPIKYCVYIIKENRTYDQVLGDLPQGNGDPALCLFGREVTPNHHALAEEFVLLDNFYVESEVSADGHEWTTAAYATDFVEKTWPLTYRGGKGKLKYPSEGSHPIAFPAGGYIWDRCREAGVSYRSYGEFIENGQTPQDPGRASVPNLEGHFDPQYRGYDLDYPDQLRADRFLAELRRFEAEGDFPRFTVMRLPNDHTYGTRAGKPTPTAMVADNDLALGRVVEALSQSRFWKEMAIFVVEDDAQNGSDHVDAHRTVAFVISPYCKRRYVDSNMYSTSSMLRTMELILGLKPMSQFDAAALPMTDAFRAQPDLTPYRHRPVTVDLKATNTVASWGSQRSEQLDFSKEDAADDIVLNEIIWRSVRGAESQMPPPVRASFVYLRAEDEDADDDGDAAEPARTRRNP